MGYLYSERAEKVLLGFFFSNIISTSTAGQLLKYSS